jgi:hypothetical protein
MASIKSGATSDQLTVDPTSKAARITLYNSAGVEMTSNGKATFAAANTFTPVATPTDLVTIYGSATKIVKVLAFIITTTNTAAGSQIFHLLRRNTIDTGGTFFPGTGVSFDSLDTATAIVGHYTANPAVTGGLLGCMNTIRVASPVALPATFAGIVQNAGFDLIPKLGFSLIRKPITLSGVNQGLAISFTAAPLYTTGAALVGGQNHTYTVVWTEE